MKSCLVNKKKTIKAFTLIEMLVSISIIGMMAAFSISSYPKFSEQISLTSETYKILTYLKETQVYGVAALNTPGVKSVISFEIDKQTNTIKRLRFENPTGSTNALYLDNSVVEPSQEIITIKDKFKISSICGDEDCENEKAYGFYRRPNPEARLLTTMGAIRKPGTDKESFKKIIITLQSKVNSEFVKKIVILQTGQMYVNDW